ncbi:MAG: Ig-like domain-containing protein [Bdellovibrionales bacterium]|nr:Ig-like domain-containing protein [Bdellovibrionales bacterium]
MSSLEITPITNSAPVGSYESYYLTAIYSDNSSQDVTSLADWTSSDASIVDIDNSTLKGRAHYISAGIAIISGAFGGITVSAGATVDTKSLTSIEIKFKNQTLPENFEQQLTAIGTYSDASTADITESVTWSSDASSVASISNVLGSKGVINGASAGTANIEAALSGVTQALAVTITSATLSQLDVFPSETFLGQGLDQQFFVTALFSDNSTLDVTDQVTWASSNSSDLNISNASKSEGFANNLYSGSGVTTVTISANKGAITGTSKVILSDATLTGITTTPASTVLNTSSGALLRAFGQYSDGGSYEITNNAFWISSNSSLGYVSNSSTSTGEVATLLAEGTVTITASYSGFQSSSAITVSDSGGESLTEAGLGLAAHYYSGSSFDSFAGLRIDSNLNFNWGTGTNGLDLTDNFSTRWIGRVRAPSSDSYVFYTNSDEGVRVYLDSNLIIDNYTPNTATTDTSAPVALSAGQEVTIIVEYFEQTGSAELGLSWSSGSLSQQPIPQAKLLPPDESSRPPGVENMAL